MSTAFKLIQTGKRFFVRCNRRNSFPRGRRISAKDAQYLRGLAGSQSFDMACVFDFGVGVFQGGAR